MGRKVFQTKNFSQNHTPQNCDILMKKIKTSHLFFSFDDDNNDDDHLNWFSFYFLSWEISKLFFNRQHKIAYSLYISYTSTSSTGSIYYILSQQQQLLKLRQHISIYSNRIIFFSLAHLKYTQDSMNPMEY